MAVTINKIDGMVDASYENVKETFPQSIAPTSGTVSSVNGLDKKIVGSGTTFLADIKRGDYIWFTTTDEVAEVENVVDDENLTLKASLITTVTGVAWKIVPKNGYRNVSWFVDDVASATVNNIAYPAGVSRSLGNSKPNGEGGGGRIAPVLIDSTVNGNTVYAVAE